MLWELPLEAAYALEHTHLWIEGANVQGQIKADDYYARLEKMKETYHARLEQHGLFGRD